MNEVSQLNLSELEKQLAERCGNLFDYNYIRESIFKDKGRTLLRYINCMNLINGFKKKFIH